MLILYAGLLLSLLLLFWACAYRRWWLLFFVVFSSVFLNCSIGCSVLGIPLTAQKLGVSLALLPLIPAVSMLGIPWKRMKTRLSLPFGLFIIIAAVSASQASFLQAGLVSIASLVLVFLLIHMVHLLLAMADPFKVKRALSLSPLLFLAFDGVAIFQYVTHNHPYLRVPGTMGNPNAMAAMLLMALPLMLTVLEQTRGARRILGAVSVFSSISVILLTFSRVVLVFLPFFLMLYALVGLSKRKVSRNLVCAVVSVILIAAAMGAVMPSDILGYFVQRAGGLISGGINVYDPSIRVRLDAAAAAWECFRAKPLLGIGLDNFRLPAFFGHSTENTYLQVLTGTGLLGFIAFSLVGLALWRSLWTGRTLKDNFLRALNRNLSLGFVVFLLLMFANDYLTSAHVWIWVAIAVTLPVLDRRLAMAKGEGCG